MQIFVRADRTHTVQVTPGTTVAALREALERQSDETDWSNCYFSLGSHILCLHASLKELGVDDGCTLKAHSRLLGGGKKRKKKTYTKPKKPRHKRQREKLRLLKMYKVEGGKVIRCKKACPRCGPGVFMGTHFDRICCGKCTLTYLYEGRETE